MEGILVMTGAGLVWLCIILVITVKIVRKKSYYAFAPQIKVRFVSWIIAAVITGPFLVFQKQTLEFSEAQDYSTSSQITAYALIIGISVCMWIISGIHEKTAIPKRIFLRDILEYLNNQIGNYIAQHGYTDSIDFMNYCANYEGFNRARAIKYRRPDYDALYMQNKSLPKEKRIDFDPNIDFDVLAAHRYEEYVKESMREQFTEKIQSVYIFDMQMVYEMQADFQQFMRRHIVLLLKKNAKGEIFSIQQQNVTVQYVMTIMSSAFSELVRRNQYREIPGENGEVMYVNNMPIELFEQNTGVQSNLVEGETLVI